ncbi:MAG: hypothetical protein IKI75_11330 [Lachnospiraceae bacterium]|nr:hypothetical protein [Lachnospiraceae bacterium]
MKRRAALFLSLCLLVTSCGKTEGIKTAAPTPTPAELNPAVDRVQEAAPTPTPTEIPLPEGPLNLKFEDLGDNSYRLSWDAVRAEHYELCRYEDGELKESRTLEQGELSCETGRLPSYENEYFTLTAVGGSAEDSTELTTGISTLYCTIWPTEDMELYMDAEGDAKAGEVSVGTALCVTGEEGERFRVYTSKGEYYINSARCMINLTEYLGGMCAYDITNSYFSNYMAHEYEIPGVSGVVTEGYEDILLDDGTFVVPLLYPVAKRLTVAAEACLEDGYRLKIYDAFRPYVATRTIYDITELQLDDPIPEEELKRVSLDEYLGRRVEEESISEDEAGEADTPEEAEETEEEPAQETAGETETISENAPDPVSENSASENAVVIPEGALIVLDPEGNRYIANPDGTFTPLPPEPEQPEVMTYRKMMMEGGYPLTVFLSAKGSRHNLGDALDLTLESLETGEELSMQTRMHDLTHFSVVNANNANAKLLQGYMYDAGFGGLYSEWWHFQDNDIMNDNPARVQKGVSIAGWKKDDRGVRYRLDNGEYISDNVAVINDVEYSFDAEGYMR